jgi:hypothetical protein
MPDIDPNLIIDVTGNTASVATDYSTSGITNSHIQIMKMAWGDANTNTRVTTSNPLPINIQTITATLGVTGSVGGLGNFKIINGVSGATTIALVVAGTTSSSYSAVQINGYVQGVTSGIPVGVTGSVFINNPNTSSTLRIQGYTSGTEVGITGGRRLNSSTDSVTVSGTVGITGGRYLLPGYDGVRIFGGNSGETMIPITVRDGSGNSIGSSGGALNVNLVGAGITATVSISTLVGICQADKTVPLFVAGATAGPAVRVKGTGASDALPVLWTTAMPVSVSGLVTVDLNLINTALTTIQSQLTGLQAEVDYITDIHSKLSTGINTIPVKPSQVQSGVLTISTSRTTFSQSTALYSGITIKSSSSNGTKDVIISGNSPQTSGGYPLSAGQSMFIETNNLQNLYFESSGAYPVSISYIAS